MTDRRGAADATQATEPAAAVARKRARSAGSVAGGGWIADAGLAGEPAAAVGAGPAGNAGGVAGGRWIADAGLAGEPAAAVGAGTARNARGVARWRRAADPGLTAEPAATVGVGKAGASAGATARFADAARARKARGTGLSRGATGLTRDTAGTAGVHGHIERDVGGDVRRRAVVRGRDGVVRGQGRVGIAGRPVAGQGEIGERAIRGGDDGAVRGRAVGRTAVTRQGAANGSRAGGARAHQGEQGDRMDKATMEESHGSILGGWPPR